MEEWNPKPKILGFPTGKKELLFGVAILFIGMALFNFIIWGGFNLGFAIASILCILFSGGYLLYSGCKLRSYPAALLGLAIVICAGFGRSNDGFVKFVMLCFVLFAVNLALCLISGQNRRDTGSVSSLLDAPRALFTFGFGQISPAGKGIADAFRSSGSIGQKSGAILIGLVIAVPVLAVMIPLLMFADAAFEGLMDLLPELDIGQAFHTVLWGGFLAMILYTRSISLRQISRQEPPTQKARQGIHVFTVNTVLVAICLLYLAYLFSQLAYVIGGFAGILPDDYTLSAYARRGFVDMALLSSINLGIIAFSVGFVRKDGAAPLSTRLLCLFIGIITVFFVAASSGKMFLYIDGYGLTRLRLLTQVIMFWLGLTTVFVMVHLFAAKFSYMRLTVVCAMVIGAVLLWADVDTIVASYNVKAYTSGKLETVDVSHLGNLSNSAVPYLQELANAADSETAQMAKDILTRQTRTYYDPDADFRGWNYATSSASVIWEQYYRTEQKEQENADALDDAVIPADAAIRKAMIFSYVDQNYKNLEVFPYDDLIFPSDKELVSHYLGEDTVVTGLLYDDQENIVGFDCGETKSEAAIFTAGIFYSAENSPWTTGLNSHTFVETAPGYLLWENEAGTERMIVEPIRENWFYMEYYEKYQ